jgi:DhnA family fructose-bisphosphate aldolase class Ia
VKDNAESSVAGNSLQSLSSLESSIPDSNAIVANAVACTPSVVKVGLQAAPTSSPSVHLSSIAESSLDMNLSESFTLGDESAYWKQDVENIDENVPAKTVVVLSGVDGPSEREVELIRELDDIRKAYEEAKEDVTRMTVMLKENERQKVRAMSCRYLFSWLKMHL